LDFIGVLVSFSFDSAHAARIEAKPFYVTRRGLYIRNEAPNVPDDGIAFHNKARVIKVLLVAIAWMYVVLMVAVVEATSPQGTVLGAVFTLLLYGVLPLGIVGYLFLSPSRRRARRRAEAAAAPATEDTPGTDADEDASAATRLDPDGRGHAPGDAVAPVRKEP
jgi:hypothetical protein